MTAAVTWIASSTATFTNSIILVVFFYSNFEWSSTNHVAYVLNVLKQMEEWVSVNEVLTWVLHVVAAVLVLHVQYQRAANSQ